MGVLNTLKDICGLTKEDYRRSISEYEEMAKGKPQVEVPITHHVHGGLYAREATLPKDTMLTGQIYKHDHLEIMLGGDITIATDYGELNRFTGFHVFKGMHGKKRAGIVHEDTHWITIHASEGHDGESIQDDITANNYGELDAFFGEASRADYENQLEKIGVSKEDMDAYSAMDNVIPFSPGHYDHLFVMESSIEGQGLFSDIDIFEGEVICFTSIETARTPAGKFINHSIYPNATFCEDGDSIYLMSNRDIKAGDEITASYFDAPAEREL